MRSSAVDFGTFDEDGSDDPMIKQIRRSTIAHTIKEARAYASLAKPSRPYTPLVDRSLFQPSLDMGLGDGPRPSSSYSLHHLNMLKETFAESRRGSGSATTLGSIPEAVPEFPPALSSGDGVDILTLDDENEFITETHRRHSVGGIGVGGPRRDSMAKSIVTEEPLPRPRSRTGSLTEHGFLESTESHTGHTRRREKKHSKRSSAAPPASEASSPPQVTPVPPSEPRGARPDSRRQSRSSRQVVADEWDEQFDVVMEKLHQLVVSEPPQLCSEELTGEMSERLWDLVKDLKSGCGSPHRCGGQAEQLLRAVMGLLDLKHEKGMFRLCRCALELLLMEEARDAIGGRGLEAGLINTVKVLLKLSKDDKNDARFRDEDIFAPLLAILSRHSPAAMAGNDEGTMLPPPSLSSDGDHELRVFVAGVLKNVTSHDAANQAAMVQQGAIKTFADLLKKTHFAGSAREAQLLIQITGTLRNLAVSSKHHKQFVMHDVLAALTGLMPLFQTSPELLLNISRLLSKLSLTNTCCEILSQNDAHVKQTAKCLGSHMDHGQLVVRLSFVLGNLTAKSDRARIQLMFDCQGSALLGALLHRYLQLDRKIRLIEGPEGKEKLRGADREEVEDVLVKVIRLLANVCINTSVGTMAAATSALVEPLLEVMGSKKVQQHEELILNAVAALTNLLYYDSPSNILFESNNKRLLCTLFRPLLLDTTNPEALMETARALGNLSRHQDVRLMLQESRIDEALVLLLDHTYRDLVYYITGVLVNLAADHDCSQRLLSTDCADADGIGLIPRLVELIRDAARERDAELVGLACKVLTNLALDRHLQWDPSDLEILHAQLSCLETTLRNWDKREGGDGGDDNGGWVHDAESLVKTSSSKDNVDAASKETALAPVEALLTLVQQLRQAVPVPTFPCPASACALKFGAESELLGHVEREHHELFLKEEENEGNEGDTDDQPRPQQKQEEEEESMEGS
ncbi:unnamed protein product [Vitrella brassicaformis CCMP3155]|uniref:Uncharacterized protein n=4 Tax=Vitrella brassicaformis TaxID=1169539 RepID=A0A0G4GZH2_VITBC|nr:unnamed protein product [Vitrella brassicaformis CCMP3155]|eukprot:CEM36404.1 unnamed protein product [Vitrella brassicaformis CCMP3155]